MPACNVKHGVGQGDRRQGQQVLQQWQTFFESVAKNKTVIPTKSHVASNSDEDIRRKPDDCSYEYRHVLRDVPSRRRHPKIDLI